MASTQSVHDRVNLLRMVTRLEDEVERRQTWGSTGISAWVKASNVAQNLGYARRLLRSVRRYEIDSTIPSASNILPDLQETLDRLEPIILETQKKLAPQRPFRKSLLGELPRPTPRPECIESIPIPPSDKQVQATVPPPRPSADPVAHVAEDLLLGPSEQTATPSHSLPPSSPALEERQPPTEKQSSGDNSTSRFLSTSLKTQEELSAQLADMAKQLKINSLHFTEALARDRIVIEGAEGKLQGNLTRIQTERGRLKLHSLKSGSTTWIVMAAIITVIVAWIVMFLIIRIT